MSRTLDDLRTTLQHYGAELPVSSPRTVSVHKRIRRIRRQRAVAGMATVVLLAGVASVVVHASARTVAGFPGKAPAYYLGGLLVTELDIDSKVSGTVSTTVTPSTTTLTFYSVSCGRNDADVGVDFMVDGHDIGGETCGGSATSTVTPGVPILVTYRLVHRNVARTTIVTDAERERLPRIRTVGGVYAPVPREQYKFPPAPKKLRSMADFGPPSEDIARGSGNSTSRGTVQLIGGVDVNVMTVAPGVVTLWIDGRQVGRVETWDYGLDQSDIALTPAALAALGIHAPTGTLTAVATDFPPYPSETLWRVLPKG